MDVLMIYEYSEEYTGMLFILGIMTLLFGVLTWVGIIDFVAMKQFKWSPFLKLCMCALVFITSILNVAYIYKQSPYTEYVARVWNIDEVYRNGFEIIGQEDDLYLLYKVHHCKICQ